MNTRRIYLSIAAAIASAPLLVTAGAGEDSSTVLHEVGHYSHAMHGGYGTRGRFYGTHASMATVSLWQSIYNLELSEEQRKEIDEITAQLHERLENLQSRRQQAASELPPLYAAEEPDSESIGAVYAELFDAKRERIEAVIDAKNRLLGALTDEQRAQLEGTQDSARPSYDS